MALPAYIRGEKDGTLVQIKLQPRASANQILEPLGAELRVKVTAPPVDAAANQALIDLLASHLHCPRSRIHLLRGHTSRHKTIKIFGMTPEQLAASLG